MKYMVKCLQLVMVTGLFLTLLTGPAWAEPLEVHNESGLYIAISCGGHVHTGTIEPGHHAMVYVDYPGQVYCLATDTHGTIVSSRIFHIHGSPDIIDWVIQHDHHH